MNTRTRGSGVITVDAAGNTEGTKGEIMGIMVNQVKWDLLRGRGGTMGRKGKKSSRQGGI